MSMSQAEQYLSSAMCSGGRYCCPGTGADSSANYTKVNDTGWEACFKDGSRLYVEISEDRTIKTTIRTPE